MFLVYSFPAHLLFSHLKNSLDGRLRKHNDQKRVRRKMMMTDFFLSPLFIMAFFSKWSHFLCTLHIMGRCDACVLLTYTPHIKYTHVSHSVMPNSLRPHGLQPTRLLCPFNSPGKNTGVGSHFLLQEIFLTQGLDPVSCTAGRFFTF